ncbi:MAG TPA: hypothetical protein VMT46_10395 [Anaerolineaceae bacterium]|nr:hypothetical protein [Anaerolineaceae bacterium]
MSEAFVSGVYYPIDVLPPLLQKLAIFSLATCVLDGTRKALLEGLPARLLSPFIWPASVNFARFHGVDHLITIFCSPFSVLSID